MSEQGQKGYEMAVGGSEARERNLQPGGYHAALIIDGLDSLRWFGVFDTKVCTETCLQIFQRPCWWAPELYALAVFQKFETDKFAAVLLSRFENSTGHCCIERMLSRLSDYPGVLLIILTSYHCSHSSLHQLTGENFRCQMGYLLLRSSSIQRR